MPKRMRAYAKRLKMYAEVAELVDAHDSGSCARKGVEVRVFSSAPFFSLLDSWIIRGATQEKISPTFPLS